MELENWIALTLSLSPRRERPELLSRLAPMNRGCQVAPTGSRLFRRLAIGAWGNGSWRSAGCQPATRQIANLRHKSTGSWAGNSLRPRWDESPDGEVNRGDREPLPLPGGERRPP